MSNLMRNESAGIWCPKTNTDINPDPSNLGGCCHCHFANAIAESGSAVLGVTCSLVPRIQFCERISILDDGSWSCLLPASLEEYRRITGDLTADAAPPNFVVPKPTSLTKCLLCVAQRRSPCRPIAERVADVQRAIVHMSSPAQQAHYPPPTSPAARTMRQTLAAANPEWKQRARQLEELVPKNEPSKPAPAVLGSGEIPDPEI